MCMGIALGERIPSLSACCVSSHGVRPNTPAVEAFQLAGYYESELRGPKLDS